MGDFSKLSDYEAFCFSEKGGKSVKFCQVCDLVHSACMFPRSSISRGIFKNLFYVVVNPLSLHHAQCFPIF